MIKRYKIENRQILPAEAETPAIWVVVTPTEDEKKWLTENFALDEHDFASAFDPEEPARMEFEPDHLALIFKRPKNYSSKDHFMFKVSTMGLFLFKDKLILALSEDIANTLPKGRAYDGKQENPHRALASLASFIVGRDR